MSRSRLPRVSLALLACLLTLPLAAQTAAAPASEPATINGGRTVFAMPAQVRPLRVAIYQGPGAPDGGIGNVAERVLQVHGATVTKLAPEEVATKLDRQHFDVVTFSGGSGSAQGKAIGEAGRAAVRKFVAEGGGYIGVCAGAYLATAGYEWGIGLVNARTVSPKWKRGRGYLDLELSDEGRALFGEVKDVFQCRYANGPIIKPAGREDLPPYAVLAWFRTEVAQNGTPVGVQINSPAIISAPYGQGRVMTLSPHSENTPGLENMLAHAFLWVASASASE